MNVATSNDCVNLLGHLSYACEGVQGAKEACKSAQNAFVIREFETWKLATTVVSQHELSAFHKEAVKLLITLPAETTDIGVAISYSELYCNQ